MTMIIGDLEIIVDSFPIIIIHRIIGIHGIMIHGMVDIMDIMVGMIMDGMEDLIMEIIGMGVITITLTIILITILDQKHIEENIMHLGH